MIRTSPHPVIPVSLSESETRRVPAPSHLAQRDVAKTHVSPGLCGLSLWREAQILVQSTWRTCRFGGNLKTNRQHNNSTRSGPFSQAVRGIFVTISYLFTYRYRLFAPFLLGNEGSSHFHLESVVWAHNVRLAPQSCVVVSRAPSRLKGLVISVPVVL